MKQLPLELEMLIFKMCHELYTNDLLEDFRSNYLILRKRFVLKELIKSMQSARAQC